MKEDVMMSNYTDSSENKIVDEKADCEQELKCEEKSEVHTDEEIEAHITELLEGDPDDFDDLDEYIDSMEEDYSEDLREFTFREAIRSGARNYVEEHADDFDLNDDEGSSSYLYETDDSDMQELLMDHGAFKSWDDSGDCRFAIETVNWEILAFDSDFQKEVFAKYLGVTGLTEKKIKEMLDEEYDQDEDSELPENFDRYFEDDCDALGISLKNGEIVLEDRVGEDGNGIEELLEELGWECKFEGDSWKLETVGVYFIA